MSSFEPAGFFLPKVSAKYGLATQATAGLLLKEIARQWKTQFPQFADQCSLAKFQHDTLFVKVDNASIGAEIFLQTQNILEQWQSHPLLKLVKNIRIIR